MNLIARAIRSQLIHSSDGVNHFIGGTRPFNQFEPTRSQNKRCVFPNQARRGF